jgi:hypothetical protein
MRTADHWLNASEILAASDLSRSRRHHYLRELSRRGFPAEGRLPVWVPFRDGVLVCQAAGLEDELEPLLSNVALARPTREENYLLLLDEPEQPHDGFGVLDTGDGKIAYKPTERYVNAAHLRELYGITQKKMSEFFSEHPYIDKQVWRGTPVYLRGSYISYENARVLCAHFKVSCGPIERLIELASAVNDADDAAANVPAALSVADHRLSGAGKPAEEAVYAHTSYFTEPSYTNGSYLAPARGSCLEVRNLENRLAPSPAYGTPHGMGRGFGSDRGGSGSWHAAGFESA